MAARVSPSTSRPTTLAGPSVRVPHDHEGLIYAPCGSAGESVLDHGATFSAVSGIQLL